MIKKLLTIISFALLAVGCSDVGTSADFNVATTTNLRNVSVLDAAVLISENKNTVILDVRTPKEFTEGHIEGALNINFYDTDFKEKIATLNKDTPYVLYCHSGGRSGKTMKTLERLGFKDVSHLK